MHSGFLMLLASKTKILAKTTFTFAPRETRLFLSFFLSDRNGHVFCFDNS